MSTGVVGLGVSTRVFTRIHPIGIRFTSMYERKFIIYLHTFHHFMVTLSQCRLLHFGTRYLLKSWNHKYYWSFKALLRKHYFSNAYDKSMYLFKSIILITCGYPLFFHFITTYIWLLYLYLYMEFSWRVVNFYISLYIHNFIPHICTTYITNLDYS